MENNYQMLFPFSSNINNTKFPTTMVNTSHSEAGFYGGVNLAVDPKAEFVHNGLSSLFGERENEGKGEKINKGKKKIRKARYAFETRSPVDILDDGYRWRKYGRKAVKNNKFPRSYYRCTYEGCNVKKQVQRLTKDEGLVITTYEGKHAHPIDKQTDNFEYILSQMQIITPF